MKFHSFGFFQVIKYKLGLNIDTLLTAVHSSCKSCLKPSSSSKSKTHMRPRTWHVKYFDLEYSVFKTKHLRHLLRGLVRGFDWLMVNKNWNDFMKTSFWPKQQRNYFGFYWPLEELGLSQGHAVQWRRKQAYQIRSSITKMVLTWLRVLPIGAHFLKSFFPFSWNLGAIHTLKDLIF